jgi:hypothetical protein
MGNIFCGEKEESTKATAFDSKDINSSSNEIPSSALHSSFPATNGNNALQNQQQQNEILNDPVELAKLQASREEEARLQLVLQQAGRAMVSVRSTRGSTPYYDQGFAAALHQHLEQTTKFPSVPNELPPSSQTPVYTSLSKPMWQDILLGKQDSGLAGLAGENPHTYIDHEAEAFLDKVQVKKERLFAGTNPMVENLL